MLLLIIGLLIYLFFWKNDSSIDDPKVFNKVNHFLKPHLNKIKQNRDNLYNCPIKERKYYQDIYQDSISDLREAMTSILIIFPKKYDTQINNYFNNILENNI